MALLGSLLVVLNMLCQAGVPLANADDIFSSAEKAELGMAAGSIEHRIKIYDAASVRIQHDLQLSVQKNDFDAVPGALKTWISALSKSLEDIEANLKAKKKSRNLIGYEIQVRKAIADTEGLKIKAPVDQQEAFDSCLAQAETIRKKFVDILFRH